MPYRRQGKIIYVKKNGRWVRKGSSKTVEMAKRYLKKLYMFG